MSVILVLLIVSLVLAVGFLGAFVWAVRSGQFEDTATPAMRMLLDDGHVENQASQSDINKTTKDTTHESGG